MGAHADDKATLARTLELVVQAAVNRKVDVLVLPPIGLDQLCMHPSEDAAEQYSKARTTSCMAKKKGVRLIITLECVEAKVAGGTPSRYTSQKNKKTHPEKLELMKYNPFLRRHTLHRELK